jgi:hypothetical protein
LTVEVKDFDEDDDIGELQIEEDEGVINEP